MGGSCMQTMTDRPSLNLFGVQMERIPDNLLLEPIEYIFADHCRQRDMCTALKALCQQKNLGDIETEWVRVMLDCLEVDLPLHVADEEKDLFPRLRQKAKPEDKFEDTLYLLSSEHERDRVLVQDVLEGIRSLANGMPIDNTNEFRTSAQVFSQIHLSHLNWENTVILELARLRLDAQDQRAMAVNMAARRGIVLPEINGNE